MKEGWKYLPFEKSIVKVKKQKSIKSKDYKEEGQYPVVSQESSLISGYFDDASILYQHDTPVVIFGDHTQNVKYVDFDFIVGADGVHILSPIAEITPKFFYYQLKSIKLRNLGYARHYKLLKQESIGYPPLPEQERIVSLLDAEFAKIDAIKANAEKQLQDAKALFQSALKDYLTPKEGWKYLPFEKSIVKVKKQKSIKSKDYKEEGQYPVVSQESSLISGYFDDASILYQHDTPVVIFGDHTQNVKYVNFDFIIGADGVHILSPITEITPKFFYYQLKSIKLRNLGYARHYKLLKQESIFYPSLSDQQQVAEQLDNLSAKIHALQSNFDTTVTLCNDIKQSILKDIFG